MSFVQRFYCSLNVYMYMATVLTLFPLYSVWRQDELHVINETTTGAERKAALCGLLEQEAQLIASIGQHKNVAAKESKEKNTRRFLEAVSRKLSTCIPTLYKKSWLLVLYNFFYAKEIFIL